MPSSDETGVSAVSAPPATISVLDGQPPQAQAQAESEAGGQVETGGGDEFSAYPSELEFGTDTSDVSCLSIDEG